MTRENRFCAEALGRSNELLDRFEDDCELLIVFLLKRFDLAGEQGLNVFAR